MVFADVLFKPPLVSEGLRAFMAWEAPSSTRVGGVLLVIGRVALKGIALGLKLEMSNPPI